MIFIYNVILFGQKKNENLSFAGKWMELENVILSEVSKVQKAACFLSCVKYRANTNTNSIMKNMSCNREEVGKGHGIVNIVQILYTHVHK
jgi:hypothetical protein